MSSSSRERADAQALALLQAKSRAQEQQVKSQQAKQESAPRVIGSRNGLTAGNAPTLSTRQRAEMAAAQEPEVLTPRTRQGAAGAFTEVNTSMSTRERQERADALARVNGETATSRIDTTWLEYEQARQREAEQRELERQQAQARINAANDERARQNMRVINLGLAFDAMRPEPATPEERAFVLARKPNGTEDELVAMIYKLRNLRQAKPDWGF